MAWENLKSKLLEALSEHVAGHGEEHHREAVQQLADTFFSAFPAEDLKALVPPVLFRDEPVEAETAEAAHDRGPHGRRRGRRVPRGLRGKRVFQLQRVWGQALC